MKKLKKKSNLWFSIAKNHNLGSVGKTCQHSKKMTLHLGCLWIKSRNFVTIVWSCEKWQAISRTMDWISPPPMSFRVKSIILNYLMYNESLLIIILTRFDCSCRKKSLSNSVQLFSLSWVAVSGLIDFMSKGHASWNWLSAWKNMVLILWKVSFQTCLLNPDSISNLFYIICIFYTTRSHKSINIHNYFETCHFILTAKLFYNLPRL